MPAPERPHSPASRSAPAKINLGLHVLSRRPDGYHDVETVLIPIGWADRLEVSPAPLGPSLNCDDPSLPTDERNLVVKAALALAAYAGVDPHVDLSLTKRVPYGAGLGGGSSDAATALLLLRDLWGVQATDTELHAIAAGLGSDVPFFLVETAAYATGRGELVEPLVDAAGRPWRMPFPLVVAVPPVRVATADAYALVEPQQEGRPDLRAAVLSNDPERWTREIANDFQGYVARRHPEVARALEVLTVSGATYQSLSGSGSSVYGVFRSNHDARDAAGALTDDGCATYVQLAA